MATTVVTPEVPVPPPATPAPAPAPVHNILDSASILVISRGYPPLTKTIRGGVVQSNADPKMLSSIKKLFDNAELRAIIRNEERLDEYIKWQAVPFPFQKGHHLIPEDLYPKIEASIVGHVEKRNRLIDEFVAVYSKAIEDARTLLGDQFNQNDYPPPTRIRSLFRFNWNYLDFTVSDKLRQADKSVYERKQAEWQTRIVEAGQAADALLTAQFKELIDHLNEKLSPSEEKNADGTEKKKKLHDSMLDKITDFLSNLPARNLTNNEQLKSFATQAQTLLNGVTTAKIKENDGLKKQVFDGFTTLKTTLDKFVVDQGVRSITFED